MEFSPTESSVITCGTKALAIANGWTLRTDVDRDAGALDQCDEASDGERCEHRLGRASLVPAAPAISFPSSRKVTPCHHLPRTKTYRSTHSARSRWDGSTAKNERAGVWGWSRHLLNVPSDSAASWRDFLASQSYWSRPAKPIQKPGIPQNLYGRR
jgi:hypothetical protein